MQGSLKNWTYQDAIDEMMEQRKAISEPITFEDAMALQSIALLLLIAVGNEDEDKQTIFQSWYMEVGMRVQHMVELDLFGDNPYGLTNP